MSMCTGSRPRQPRAYKYLPHIYRDRLGQWVCYSALGMSVWRGVGISPQQAYDDWRFNVVMSTS